MTWRDIYREVKAEIGTGRLPAGAQLPPQAHLADRFRANRHAVRRALAALTDDGLVTSSQGRGTFVKDAPLDHWITDRPRLRRDAAAQGREVSVVGTNALLRRSLPEISDLLELGRRDRLAMGERLTLLDGRPVQLARHYLDAGRFPGILETLETRNSIREALAEHGVSDYRRDRTRITARQPTTSEKTVLDIEQGQPVVVATTRCNDASGASILVTVTISPGDRMHLLV